MSAVYANCINHVILLTHTSWSLALRTIVIILLKIERKIRTTFDAPLSDYSLELLFPYYEYTLTHVYIRLPFTNMILQTFGNFLERPIGNV